MANQMGQIYWLLSAKLILKKNSINKLSMLFWNMWKICFINTQWDCSRQNTGLHDASYDETIPQIITDKAHKRTWFDCAMCMSSKYVSKLVSIIIAHKQFVFWKELHQLNGFVESLNKMPPISIWKIALLCNYFDRNFTWLECYFLCNDNAIMCCYCYYFYWKISNKYLVHLVYLKTMVYFGENPLNGIGSSILCWQFNQNGLSFQIKCKSIFTELSSKARLLATTKLFLRTYILKRQSKFLATKNANQYWPEFVA